MRQVMLALTKVQLRALLCCSNVSLCINLAGHAAYALV